MLALHWHHWLNYEYNISLARAPNTWPIFHNMCYRHSVTVVVIFCSHVRHGFNGQFVMRYEPAVRRLSHTATGKVITAVAVIALAGWLVIMATLVSSAAGCYQARLAALPAAPVMVVVDVVCVVTVHCRLPHTGH